MKTYPVKKAILSSSLIAIIAFGAANANDVVEAEVNRTYTDPITGETKYATRLLSEMSDTEKALLSNEEYRALQELEAKLEASESEDTSDE